jgi:hypothetical protein
MGFLDFPPHHIDKMNRQEWCWCLLGVGIVAWWIMRTTFQCVEGLEECTRTKFEKCFSKNLTTAAVADEYQSILAEKGYLKEEVKDIQRRYEIRFKIGKVFMKDLNLRSVSNSFPYAQIVSGDNPDLLSTIAISGQLPEITLDVLYPAPSKGEDGEQGDPGSSGERGGPGVQGPRGPTGFSQPPLM